MFHLAVTAALIGTAAAQNSELLADADGLTVRLTRQDTDLRVQRQVTTDVGAAIDALDSRFAEARLDARDAAFNATLTALASANARIDALTQTVAGLTGQVSARLETAESALSTTASNQQAELSRTLSTSNSAMDATLAAINSTIDNDINAALTRITGTLSSQTSTVTALTGALSTSIGAKKDNSVHMWTGGCASTTGSGWNNVCLNRVHFISAAPYFRVSDGYKFTALRAGIYSYQLFHIYRSSGWQHTEIWMANARRTQGNNYWMHRHEGGSQWRDAHSYCMYPHAAGQKFWGRAHSGSWNSFHSVGSEHLRVTAVYQGDRTAEQ